MSKELYENESFERFKTLIPPNPHEWEGCVVLYEAFTGDFFNVAFGSGDNIEDNNLDEGFDDYIMVEQYAPTEGADLDDIIYQAKTQGFIDGDTPGLREVDGGQLLLKHKEWENGDIRRFIIGALEFAGHGAPAEVHNAGRDYDGVIYIGADYDLWYRK